MKNIQLLLLLLSLSLISPVLAEDHDPAERDWLVGSALYQKNDFALAQRRLDQFLEEAPEHPAAAQARYLLGMCAYRQKNWAAAADDFSRLFTDFPNNDYRNEASFYLAICLYHQNKYAGAEKLFSALSAQELPRDLGDRVRLWLGETYFAQKRWDEALAAWNKIDLAGSPLPDPGFVLYNVGWIHLEQNRPLEAVKYLRQAAQDTASGPLALSAKEAEARALLSAKLYDRAIAAYQELITLDTSQKYTAAANFGLAEAYFYLENYDLAKKEYACVAQNFPNTDQAPGAWYGLGWIAYKNADWETAAADFDYLWQKYPASPRRWQAGYYLVSCYAKLGQAAASKKILDELLASAKDKDQKIQVQLGLANIAFEEKAYRTASELAEKVLAAGPKSETANEALNLLGKSYYQNGDFQKAAQTFTKLLDQTTDLTIKDQLLYKIGLCDYRQNKYPDAAQSWQRLITECPWSPLVEDARLMSAEAYYQAGKYDLARQNYQMIVQDDPKSEPAAKAAYGSAFCLLKKGDTASALAGLRSLAEDWPQNDLAPQALLKAGDIYFNRGNSVEAAAVYQKVIHLYPKTDQRLTAQFQLGWIELREENFAPAAERFLALAQAFPRSAKAAEAVYWAGWAYFRKEEYRQSAATWQKLKKDYPDSSFSRQAEPLIADSLFNAKELPASVQKVKNTAQSEDKGPLLDIPDIIITGQDEFKVPAVEKETGAPAAPVEKEMPSLEAKEQEIPGAAKLLPGEPQYPVTFRGLSQLRLAAGLPGVFDWSGYSVQKFSGLNLIFNLTGSTYGGPTAPRRQNDLHFSGLIDIDASPRQIFSLGAGLDQTGRGVQGYGDPDSQSFLAGNFDLYWKNSFDDQTDLTGRLKFSAGQFQPLPARPTYRDLDGQASARYKTNWAGHLLTAGVDLKYEKLAGNTGTLVRLDLADGLSWDELDLTAGFKLIWDKDLSANNTLYLLPQVRLGWSTCRDGLIYFNFQNDVQAPEFSSLYAKNLNADIEPVLRYPVTTWSPRLGYKQTLAAWATLDISLWQETTQNFIIWTDPNSDALWTPTNIGEAQKQGLTLKLSGDLSRELTAGFSYTLADAFNRSQPDQVVPYEPKHRLDMDLAYSYRPWEIIFKTALAYAGERYGTTSGSSTLPGYFTLDLLAEKRWGDWGVFAEADNIFDQEYDLRQNVKAPGRIIKAGVMAVF